MPLAALKDVTDAIEATTDFLLPITSARWLRMALIVFFVAGGGGLSAPFNVGSSASGSSGTVPVADGSLAVSGPDLPPLDEVLFPIAAAVAAIVAFGLVVWAIGSVMEFVFVEALRSETVRVRRSFRAHLGRGLRLFGFRVGVSLLSLTLLAGYGGAIAFGVIGGRPLQWGGAEVIAFVALLLPVVAVVAAIHGLLLGFTTVFVVPIMLDHELGVLRAWRRFWPALRTNLVEFAVYAVLGVLLTIGAGLATGTVVAVSAVLVLIPFAILGGLAFVLAGSSLTTPVLAVLGLFALLYLAVVLTVAALVAVPFQTFLRYYALLVLGDIEPDFDAIPDVRARVRERGDTPPTAG